MLGDYYSLFAGKDKPPKNKRATCVMLKAQAARYGFKDAVSVADG
jgi:hypothetical protein